MWRCKVLFFRMFVIDTKFQTLLYFTHKVICKYMYLVQQVFCSFNVKNVTSSYQRICYAIFQCGSPKIKYCFWHYKAFNPFGISLPFNCHTQRHLDYVRLFCFSFRSGRDFRWCVLRSAGVGFIPRHPRNNHEWLHAVGSAPGRLHLQQGSLHHGEETAGSWNRKFRIRGVLKSG